MPDVRRNRRAAQPSPPMLPCLARSGSVAKLAQPFCTSEYVELIEKSITRVIRASRRGRSFPMQGFPSRASVIESKPLGKSVSCRVLKKVGVDATTMNASKDNRSADRAVAGEANGQHSPGGMVKPSSPWFRAARREALKGAPPQLPRR
jgi:hypothetical protein